MCVVTNVAKKMFLTEAELFPSFLACYNFGRGLFTDRKDGPHIVASRRILVWKIFQDKLYKKDILNVLFDEENYIIEWHFDYVLHAESEVKTEIFFFHWKGMNALKGSSPLPSDQDVENAIVERIYQWGEPPVFFQIFHQDKLIVLSGSEENFNLHIPHLLFLRGEVVNEFHLFEVPFSWKSFRSRAVFFIVVPIKKTVYIWYGVCVKQNFVSSVKKCNNLYSSVKKVHEFWKDFEFLEMKEGEDTLLNEILGETKACNIREISCTPKLFYLLFNGDDINPVEVKSPLRAPNVDVPFPFVQTHLYSAAQPGK